MIHSAVGHIRTINGKNFVETSRGDIGFALFGPYTRLSAGNYAVIYDIRIPAAEQNGRINENIVCYVEVVADAGAQVFARKPISASTLKDATSLITQDFSLDTTTTVEFRVYVTGSAPLVIAVERPVKSQQPRSRYWPILEDEAAPHDDIFSNHFDKFLYLHELGAIIQPDSKTTHVRLFDINFCVENYDDFQLINEIFIHNIYGFESPKPVCVFDIGMNVGLASLYFASKAHVRLVHSFEPFAAPFARALEHFDKNIRLRDKIKAHNYGLSNTTKTLKVRYDEQHTIATSIRGSAGGKFTKIQVKDAAEVLGDLFVNAISNGMEVVVKLDCEGSEFSIFEALERADLLRHVRIVMAEWHKSWAAGKTQHDIIRPLIKAGFRVFNQTNPFDPYAGQIYAVQADAVLA